MSEEKEKTIEEKIFETLDDWRHLPKYQLERRADIFFAIYLKEILKRCLDGNPIIDLIIPEFPIRKNKKNYLSCNIDYMCLSKNKDKNKGIIYFVELKTDNDSVKDEQYKLMKEFDEQKPEDFINGIIALTLQENSKSKRTLAKWRKYIYLFQVFEENGCLNSNYKFKEEIENNIKDSKKVTRKDINKEINKVKLIDGYDNYNIESIYILPKKDDDIKCRQITFEKIASEFKYEDFQNDPFLKRFIDSLKIWKNPGFHEEEIQS